MVIPNKLRFVYRVISALVAGIFLFQQVAWAGDLIDTTLERLNTQQTQTFAPSYLQNQQSVQETLVGQKQDIENFSVTQTTVSNTTTTTDETLPLKGPMSTDTGATLKSSTVLTSESSSQSSSTDSQSGSILSITTQAGDIIHYKEGVIEYIEKKNEDGSFTVIKGIEGSEFVDSSNNLKNAKITYSDKTIEIVKEGIVDTITRPDGTIYHYNVDNSIKYVLYEDKTITLYSYDKDLDGNNQTMLEDYLNGSYAIEEDGSITILPLEEGSEELHKPEKTVTYNKEGKLKLVVYNTGKTIQYDDNGMILYLKDENSREYFFDGVTQEDGTTQRSISKLIDKDATFYFDGNNDISSTEIEDTNGIKGTYDNAGSLIAVDDHGKKVTKEYLDIQNETVIAPIENEWCSRRNNSLHYSGIFFDKMSAYDYWTDVSWGRQPLPGISYEEACENRAKAKEELEAARIDMDAAYGLERQISEAEHAAFAELKPSLYLFWKFPALLSDYRYSDGTAPSFDLESIKQPLPFLKVKYQADGSISEILKTNGEIIKYNSDLSIDVISGVENTAYTFESTNLDSIKNIIVERANVKRVYDPTTGELLSIEYDGTNVLFDNNSIGFTIDGSMLTAPKFDGDGNITDGTLEKRDDSGNVIGAATYENGALSFYTDNAGNEYRYYADGNLKELKKKTKSGDFITYNYTSSPVLVLAAPPDQIPSLNPGDPILIKYENTSSGRRIIYLETKDGNYKSFEYTEDGGITVTEGTIETVDSQKVLKEETVKKYNEGLQLISSEDKDGTINQYEYNPDKTLLRIAVVKNSVSYVFENNKLIRSAKDGLTTTYYDSGLVKSVEVSTGVVETYRYGTNTAVSLNTVDALTSGKLDNTAYDQLPNNVVELHLDREHADYGDGRDGALNVSAGQTVYIDGPKQYSSINIEAGAVVTVAPWDGTSGGDIEIQCNGPVVIDGILQADAKGYRGGTSIANSWDAYGQQGESVSSDGTVVSGGYSYDPNYGGGGGGRNGSGNAPYYHSGSSGGGGSYGTSGESAWVAPNVNNTKPGQCGNVYGDEELNGFYMGSGGGKGGAHSRHISTGGNGGSGGGKIKIIGESVTINGTISANGGDGEDGVNYSEGGGGGGGGGSGGAVWIIAGDLNYGNISVKGGKGGKSYCENSPTGGNGGDGRIRIDYANLIGEPPTEVYRKQLDYATQGTFESEVIEVNSPYFQDISWIEDAPDGTDVIIETRSGNTATPDNSWGNWSAPLTDPSGSKILSDGAKYIQFRITFTTTTDKTVTPKVILNDTNGINIGYVAMQDGDINPLDMSLVETTQGTDINYYTSDGKNIHNSDDSINISSLKSDASYIESMISHANDYLNAGLNLDPGAGLNYDESSSLVWTGKVNPDDSTKLDGDEAVYLNYEVVLDNGVEKKQITYAKTKNGDEKYYSYGTNTGMVEDIKDAAGKTYSYKISIYNANGVITQAELLYDDETKNQIINYENGKIHDATQNGVEILQYSYETLEGGRDATVITDISSGKDNAVNKYYVDGQLVKTIDKDKVETAYTYDENGRILTSTISRCGKTMDIYEYSYDEVNNYTVIEDMAGVKKTYNNVNKLLFIEKDNKVYAYYYSQGQTSVANDDIEKIKNYMTDLQELADTNELLDNTDLIADSGQVEDNFTYTPTDNFAVEELTQYTDEDGNVIKYNEGLIKDITRKDGVKISEIVYDGDNIRGYTLTLPATMGGAKYIIKDGYVYKEEKGGSAITYYSNGWVMSVKDAEGKETSYIYEVPLTVNGDIAGTTYYTHLTDSTLTLDDGATKGTFIADPAEVNAKDIRNIDWSSVVPNGASVVIQIRTTDSLNEDDVDSSPWSVWSSEISTPQALAGIVAGKYLQYKITLNKPSDGTSPSIDLKSIKIDILSYLSDGNDESLTHVIEKDGKSYVYDGLERLIKIIDGDITYTYTSEGKIKSIVEAGGKTTTYIYDSENVTSLKEVVINSEGEELHYDAEKRLTKVINSSDGMEYEYFYNGDVVTVKTTHVSKQASKEDFDNFTKDGIAINDYEGVTHILLDRQVPLEYGTGLDGILTVKKGETHVLAAGTYNFESIYIEEGATLTVEPWNGTTGGQLIIRCEKEVVIDGKVDLSYIGYRGGKSDFDNGDPGECPLGTDGGGTGGDNGNECDTQGCGGGGGGYTTRGDNGSGSMGGVGGAIYGDDEITTLYMGSGGGGGAGFNASNWAAGGDGGNGGGAIEIVAPIINVNGSISADGQDGKEPTNKDGNVDTRGGYGGGGSGGSIVLSGEQVSIVGSVTAKGGLAGGYLEDGTKLGMAGGDGSAGRIRINSGVMEGEIFRGSDVISQPTVYLNQLTYGIDDKGILTSSAIELDMGDSGDITGYLNANLDIPVLSNVKIETRTSSTGDINNQVDWSGWQEATLDQNGYKINSTVNKFIQYRIMLSTKENDKSPSIYALNDFAIKLTFTNTENFSADTTVTYKAAASFPDTISFPTVNVGASDMIKSVITDAGMPIADLSSLVSAHPAYTSDDVANYTSELYSSVLDNSEPIATKFAIDANGSMKAEYIQKKDGSIEHYETDGKVRFVTNAKGELLVRYYYDDEGNLKDVRLWAERNNLNHEIVSTQNAILEKEMDDLKSLAEAVGANHTQLDTQIAEVQAELDKARAEIESMRYISYEAQVASLFGTKKVTVTIENPYYAMMISKVDLAERKFRDNAECAYFSLKNMENVSRGRIEASAASALSNLNSQQNVCMVQILRKELTTVIYGYYLKYLGRLPSTEELNDKIESLAQKSSLLQNSYTIKVDELKAELEVSSDRNSRIQEIEDIVSGVENAITDVYFASEDSRNELIESLGLTGENIAVLTDADWLIIDEWLRTNQDETMHFGQSAFLALKQLIDDYYKANPEAVNSAESGTDRYVRLAVRCILIDILAGVINPFTEGDLELSMFALSKVAQAEGLIIDAYKLTWDDLVLCVADYQNTTREKVIVHTSSDHYVVATGIDAENNVTYYEPNMGTTGESVTVSKDEFLNIWKGYTLSARAPPDTSKKLTSLEAQKIKGSNIFIAISIFFSLVSFGLSFIDNEFCQIMSKIFAVVAVVTAGLEILSSITIKGIFDSLATSISFFKDMFTTSFAKIGDFFSGTLVPFIETKVLPNIGANIINTVLSIPFTITISKGLEFMGMDVRFANIVTSFISAGTFGIGTKLFDFNLGGALEGLVIQGVSELGDVFGVDPNLTHIIGITAGVIIDVGINGIWVPSGDGIGGELLTGAEAIGYKLGTTILPNLTGELAYYGVTKLGEMLGVDSRISYLAGIGIRSSINAGLSDGWSAESIWNGVKNGLIQGITNVSLDFVSQTFNINPLLTELGFNTISSAISGLMSAWSSNAPPIESVFGSILNGWQSATLNLFKLGLQDPNNAWQQAAYIANIQNFADIVMNGGSGFDGLVNAINTYASSMLRAGTIQGMMNIGTTVANYVSQQFNNMATMMSTRQEEDGKTYAYMRLPGSENYDPDLPAWAQDYMKFEQGEDGKYYMVGIKEGDTSRFGSFGIDAYGEFGMTNGTLLQKLNDNYEAYRRIENGTQKSMDLIDYSTGEIIGFLYKNDNGTWNFIDANTSFDISFDVTGDDIAKLSTNYNLGLSDESKSLLSAIGINANEFGTIDLTMLNGQYYDANSLRLTLGLNDDTKTLLNEHPELFNYILKQSIISMQDENNTTSLSNGLLINSLTRWIDGRSNLDISSFRNVDVMDGVIDARYNSNEAQRIKELMASANDNLTQQNSKVPINGYVATGKTIEGQTSDGANVEVSNWSGEKFLSNESIWSTLGINDAESNKYLNAEVAIKQDVIDNTTKVEGCLTSKSLGTFSRGIGDTSGTFRVDSGIYTHLSTATLDSTNYTFISESNGGAYLGLGYDSIYGLTQSQNSTEGLVSIPKEVLKGERVAITSDEKYGKLVYDILKGDKSTLTGEEVNLINTKTFEIAKIALQSVNPGMSDAEIKTISDSQSNNIIDVALGISYNPSQTSEKGLLNVFTSAELQKDFSSIIVLQ